LKFKKENQNTYDFTYVTVILSTLLVTLQFALFLGLRLGVVSLTKVLY